MDLLTIVKRESLNEWTSMWTTFVTSSSTRYEQIYPRLLRYRCYDKNFVSRSFYVSVTKTINQPRVLFGTPRKDWIVITTYR